MSKYKNCSSFFLVQNKKAIARLDYCIKRCMFLASYIESSIADKNVSMFPLYFAIPIENDKWKGSLEWILNCRTFCSIRFFKAKASSLVLKLCAGHGMSSVGDKPTTGSYRQV